MSFPDKGTIPPSTFYNLQGFNTFLNQNQTFKSTFRDYTIRQTGIDSAFVNKALQQYVYSSTIDVYGSTIILSSLALNVENFPLPLTVTNLGFNQQQKYISQLNTFRQVYAYNSNAYVTASTMNFVPGPVYYNFPTYSKLNEYRAGVALVNKLYPFETILSYWTIPFPIAM
jgi:hypothetical protein